MLKKCALVLVATSSCIAFSPSHVPLPLAKTFCRSSTALKSASAASTPGDLPSTSATADTDDEPRTKQEERIKQIRKEGGPFAFNTKFGALNPYGIYYGLVSVSLGLVWFAFMSLSSLFYKLTGDRFDKKRRIPIFLGHVWGTLLLALTGNIPKIENSSIIKEFHESGRKAMFVSNHNSWMDIPFIGHAIGWLNYKFIAKKELEKVPILGKSLVVAKHVLIDRSNRKSQLLTFKQGMKWMDDGVNLVTFPEGTRSRSGRLMEFKNGAFKMAYKAGAPVVPISICGAGKIMPSYWMMPFRPGRSICKVVVHEPVESKDKTEDELAEIVIASIVKGLPEDQKPLVHN